MTIEESKKPKLLDIFTERPGRYRLLEKGLHTSGIGDKGWTSIKLLETGCAYGDAAAYLVDKYNCRVLGIDLSPSSIEEAARRHRDLVRSGNLGFLVGDSTMLPFKNEEFDCLISEAAFTPILDKECAVSEYYRVLKKGGKLVINDFAVKGSCTDRAVADVLIPCFQGVDRKEVYKELIENSGFHCLHCNEELGEFISLALWVSKALGVKIRDVGSYLYECFGTDRQDDKKPLFSQVGMTYCQMVFERK